MFARLAAYEGRDPARTDALVEAMRGPASSGGELEGLRRLLLLGSRDDTSHLEVAVFDSSAALHAAEPVLDAIGEELGQAGRGTRAALHIYEVAVNQVTDGARCARVTRLEGSPDRVDDGVLFVNESVVPRLRELAGWSGLLVLIDRGWRELPIEARYVGRMVQTAANEIIEVKFREIDGVEKVLLVEKTG